MTDCKHDRIQTWRFDDGTPAGMWSCVDCAMKFVPLAYSMDAVNAEREACAKVCERKGAIKYAGLTIGEQCAAAIRARGIK